MTAMTPFHTTDGTIHLEQIPHAAMSAQSIGPTLAKINRFGGRTPTAWSVAVHSVLVSRLCTTAEERALALLHDAHEAFLGDWITPAVIFIANQSRPVAGAIVENAIKQAKAEIDRQIFAAWALRLTDTQIRVVQYFDLIAYLAESITFFGMDSMIDLPVAPYKESDLERALELIGELPSDANWRLSNEIWKEEIRALAITGAFRLP